MNMFMNIKSVTEVSGNLSAWDKDAAEVNTIFATVLL